MTHYENKKRKGTRGEKKYRTMIDLVEKWENVDRQECVVKIQRNEINIS